MWRHPQPQSQIGAGGVKLWRCGNRAALCFRFGDKTCCPGPGFPGDVGGNFLQIGQRTGERSGRRGRLIRSGADQTGRAAGQRPKQRPALAHCRYLLAPGAGFPARQSCGAGAKSRAVENVSHGELQASTESRESRELCSIAHRRRDWPVALHPAGRSTSLGGASCTFVALAASLETDHRRRAYQFAGRRHLTPKPSASTPSPGKISHDRTWWNVIGVRNSHCRLKRRHLSHLARHGRDAVASIGRECLQQSQLLQEHRISRRDLLR